MTDDNRKRSGLAGSFLFGRRAEPVSDAPNVSDVSDVQTPPVPAISKPRQPVSRASKPLSLRDRCTIYLERTVNDRLDLVARIEGRERSEVVTELLQKHLPKYRIESE